MGPRELGSCTVGSDLPRSQASPCPQTARWNSGRCPWTPRAPDPEGTKHKRRDFIPWDLLPHLGKVAGQLEGGDRTGESLGVQIHTLTRHLTTQTCFLQLKNGDTGTS